MLGVIAVAFAIVGIWIAFHWQTVTRAGHAFLLLRWFTASVIEANSGLNPISLGGIENDWYKASSTSGKSKKYYPFLDEASGLKNFSIAEKMKDIGISPKEKVGGWRSSEGVAELFKWVWFILGVGGLLLIVGVILGTV